MKGINLRHTDIKQGEIYRLKSSPKYGFVKVLCVLKPKQTLFYKSCEGDFRADKNESSIIIVRCIHSANKCFGFGLIRDFKPKEIIK